MHKGRYIRWDPFHGIEGRWSVESLHDDREGFRVLLRAEDPTKPMLRLAFERPLLYQVTDEGFRLSGANDDSQFAFPHPFYIVERSPLVAEFHRSSVNILENWDIKHFAIYSTDDCVDVLSVHSPKADEL